MIDDHAKSPVFAEEGQAITAAVVINAALGLAGDLARAHLLLEQRQRDAETLGNDRCIDRDGAVFKFDRFHLMFMPLPAPGSCLTGRDRRIPPA